MSSNHVKTFIADVIGKISWVGLLVALMFLTVCIVSHAPLWILLIAVAAAYWQGHYYSRTMSKGSDDPNFFLRSFFTAPGEKAHYRRLALYWYAITSALGGAYQSAVYYKFVPSGISQTAAFFVLSITLVPLAILLILSVRAKQ